MENEGSRPIDVVAVPSLARSLLTGSLGFGAVSLCVFATVAYGERWMYLQLGLLGAYLAWTALFILLGGGVLGSLVVRRWEMPKFFLLFAAAFFAYAAGWVVAYFFLGPVMGEWIGSLAASLLMGLVFAAGFGVTDSVYRLSAILFVANSLGYFVGSAVNDSLEGRAGMLLWGLIYGLCLGAGIGAVLHLAQVRSVAVASNAVKNLVAIIAVVLGTGSVSASSQPKMISIPSPDGKLVVKFHLNTAGAPYYSIQLDGRRVLRDSRLGLVRDDADFTHGLRLLYSSRIQPVRDRYEILTAKRRVNTYSANRKVFHLQTAAGQKTYIIFQVSNDGAAFRYFFPETDAKLHRLTEEVSSFHFLPNTRAWLQPMSVAKSGWKESNPSYEEFYEKDIPAGTPSPTGAGWVYPALFRSGDTWMLVSETGLSRSYCGTRLRSESPDGEYAVGFPDPREGFQGGAVNPQSKLPWLTPWRIIVVGSLKTVAESMLGVDLADKAMRPAGSAIKPGKASWSWPLLGDDQTTYEVQKRFIDYAAEMGWRYCLIDALWDKQIGYEKIKALVDYARGKGVGILLWYNSAGDWNSTPQTPRDLMLTHESRVREFERLKAMGIAGLKIDFFGGDGQSTIGYYLDIIEDASAYGFLLNFHGATLPRGWQRTYPHLMTMEAIRGLEFVTFEQKNADEEPAHAAMLPFTRNVFDPMDFTPMVLDRINRIQRRTSSAFELALSVLFTSGIQHYAEIPDGMAKAPAYVRDLLKGVPSVWDDTKFLDGYPGKFVVLARRGEGRWYVAGINGETTEQKLTLKMDELGIRGSGILITDGAVGNLSFRQTMVHLASDKMLQVMLQPRAGFVMVVE
ncbi:MAG: glycoside hydrolase family 97 catalytic domain-containing protein [Pyrinomonadaceae bacterium]